MGQVSALFAPAVQKLPLLRERPLDLVHLAKQTLGDWSLECEVLRLFDSTAHSYLRKIGAGGDRDELAVAVDGLIGASRGVGAWGLAELASAAGVELVEQGAIQGETLLDLEMALAEISTFIHEVVLAETA